MPLDVIAEGILKERSGRAAFQHQMEWAARSVRLRVLAAQESRKTPVTHRTSRCPACGQGVKRKVIGLDTLVLCPGCNATWKLKGIQEGVLIGESFTSGVTGVPRGRPVVVFDERGKIKRMEGV